eukprot:363885-Chlamydomonas_euryale.AAC.22
MNQCGVDCPSPCSLLHPTFPPLCAEATTHSICVPDVGCACVGVAATGRHRIGARVPPGAARAHAHAGRSVWVRLGLRAHSFLQGRAAALDYEAGCAYS